MLSKNLIMGTVAHAAGNVVSQLIGLYVLSCLSRLTTVEEFGEVTANFYLLSFLTIVVSYGYSQWAIVKLTNHPEDAASLGAYISRRKLPLLFLSLTIYFFWILYQREKEALGVVGVAALTLCAFVFDRRYEFIAKIRTTYTSILNPSGQFVSLFILTLLVGIDILSTSLMFLVMSIAIAVPPAASYFMSKFFHVPNNQFHKVNITSQDVDSVKKIGVGNIFVALTTTLMPSLVLFLYGKDLAGFFAAAYRIVVLLLMGFSLFYSFLMPIIAIRCNNRLNMLDFVRKFALIQLLLSSVLALFLLQFCSEIITFLYGPDYHGAAIIFEMLIMSLMIISPLSIFFCNVLLANRMHKQYSIAVILSPVVALITLLILYKPLGINALAASLFIGEAVIVSVSFYSVFTRRACI